MAVKYYNPDAIMQKKDINGNRPQYYMVEGNRSAGKTTGFLKKQLELFKKKKRHFALFYRTKTELRGCHNIYKDVLELYPKLGSEMKSNNVANIYREMRLDGELCGFAIPISDPDSIKKYSAVFTKVDMVILDEFQKEDGRYLKKEMKKLLSVIQSISRGGGEQVRHVDVFLLGNKVNLMNPYYIYFGVYKRIQENTHFLRGDGWVCEFVFNESAADAIKASANYRAAKEDAYMKMAAENIYLFDNKAFIDKPTGKYKYMYTIVSDGEYIGVYDYWEVGIIYITKDYNPSFKMVITFNNKDHSTSSVLMSRSNFVLRGLKEFYELGLMRFDSMRTKNIIFDIIAINIYSE